MYFNESNYVETETAKIFKFNLFNPNSNVHFGIFTLINTSFSISKAISNENMHLWYAVQITYIRRVTGCKIPKAALIYQHKEYNYILLHVVNYCHRIYESLVP